MCNHFLALCLSVLPVFSLTDLLGNHSNGSTSLSTGASKAKGGTPRHSLLGKVLRQQSEKNAGGRRSVHGQRGNSGIMARGFARIEAVQEPATISSQAALDELLEALERQPSLQQMPPVPKHGGPLTVGVSIQIVKFKDIKEIEGTVDLVLDLTLCWSDDRLPPKGFARSGDAATGDQTPPIAFHDKLTLAPRLVWTPDVVVLNQVSAMDDMFGFGNSPLVLTDNDFKAKTGVNVLWTRRLSLESACKIDMSNFPFDKQTCSIVVGSWATSRRQMLLIPQDWQQKVGPADGGSIHTSEFSVGNITVQHKSVYMRNAAERFEELVYELTVRRYPHFYIVNFMLPMVAVTMLTISTMWMSNTGTRTNAGTRLFLTLISIMNITAMWRPANDTDIWLDRFQAHCLALCMSAVLQSLVLDYLINAGLFKLSWVPRSENVEVALRSAICLAGMGVFFVDLSDLVKRHDVEGLFFAFHGRTTRMLMAFVYLIFMCLGFSAVTSSMWMILPSWAWRLLCGKACTPIASGGDELSRVGETA